MPQSSAFFLNYIIIQGFFVALFRIFFPHPGVLIAIFRIFGCCSAPVLDTPTTHGPSPGMPVLRMQNVGMRHAATSASGPHALTDFAPACCSFM